MEGGVLDHVCRVGALKLRVPGVGLGRGTTMERSQAEERQEEERQQLTSLTQQNILIPSMSTLSQSHVLNVSIKIHLWYGFFLSCCDLVF